MIDMADQQPPDVPQELHGMIELNSAYSVLICPHDQCRRAIQPSAFARHSWEEHNTTFSARQKLKTFIRKLGWKHDPRTVDLPDNWSKPQASIPVFDVFVCESCEADPNPVPDQRPFISSSEKRTRTHWYMVHWDTAQAKDRRKRGAAKYRKARGQTWFRGGGEARYWLVQENENDNRARQAPVEVAGVVQGESAVGDTVITVSSTDDPVDPPREDATAAVIVIDSDDEVLVPRRKGATRAVEVSSSDDCVGMPEEVATAAVIVIDSDNEVPVPRGKQSTRAVECESSDESNGDADYIPSEEASSDDEDDSSTVEAEASDAEHSDVRQPIAVDIAPRPKKRKVQPASAPGIGSDDDIYHPSSPRFEQSPKRLQRMSPFVDSGVVMPPSSEPRCPSSTNNRFIITSSPPIVGWTIQSQPDGDDRLRHAGRVTVPVTHDTDEIPQGTVRSPVPFVFGRRQPTSDALQEHLEMWCQACPACVTVTDVKKVMHHIEDCWRADTVELVKRTHATQQYIDEHGGFRGRDGCARCGVPRTICQRWQARPGGGGWEEVAGGACQYEKRLAAAVTTMLMDGCAEGWDIAKEWMTRAGVRLNKQDEVYEWFRGPAWWADMAMEVSRMAHVFHMLAGKNRRVVRM
jgi:hypothetical protein